MSPDTLAALLRGRSVTWDRVGCDPIALLGACRDEEVSGLIYYHLRDTPQFASWPPVVRTALGDASRAAVARGLLGQQERRRGRARRGGRGAGPPWRGSCWCSRS